MRLSPQIRRRHSEQGYIMLALLLMMALMIIFAAAIVPSITFDIKRDREEEMVHRGVQYSRAIRAYYKKFGRYPAKIEDLENTNQMRFLRKRYKDPITGKDFKLLHYGEAKMTMNGVAGGMIPGANTLGANGALTNNSMNQPSTPFGGNSAFGASSNSPLGQNSQPNTPTAAGDPTQPGTDTSQPGSQPSNADPGANQSAAGSTTGSSSDKLANTQFGGAPIVGVASLSKDKTIREFDKKKKYNEWQFVYDPTMDRGMLITTPYQQQQAGFGMQGTPNLNGQINGPNAPNGGFGNTFGNSPNGMQNTPAQPTSGFGTSTPASNPPQQQ